MGYFIYTIFFEVHPSLAPVNPDATLVHPGRSSNKGCCAALSYYDQPNVLYIYRVLKWRVTEDFFLFCKQHLFKGSLEYYFRPEGVRLLPKEKIRFV